jgi:hypothetical protein
MLRSDFLPHDRDSWFAVVRRYKGAVRAEVERAGLSGDAAVVKAAVIIVFFLMEKVEELPQDAPLGPHLCALARRVAQRAA